MKKLCAFIYLSLAIGNILCAEATVGHLKVQGKGAGNRESKYDTAVIDLNGTTWCSYGDDGKPGVLLYFKDGYYMEMFSSLKGDFSMPSERIKYKLSIKDSAIFIVPMSSPKLPPFIVRENGSYLDETWPIGQGRTVYKRLSEHNTNKLLKNPIINQNNEA